MDEIPRSTIERLPLYKKTIQTLVLSGQTHASSEEIARLIHLSDAQIRKDLSYFGNFGVRGKGYDLESLIEKISEILGTTRLFPCVLVGVGNLGQALLSYGGFEDRNFKIEAAFDADPEKTGKTFGDCEVHPANQLGNYLDDSDIELAILAVPAPAAPDVFETLVDHDVRGILNFAPFVPEVPEGVAVESVDLSTNLEVLAYFLNN
ncbi:MAG: redox-sensing transcriptional repressor Rex [bacterium]